MIKATPHTICRACKSQLPPAFLDLGMQPLANNLCTADDHCDDVFPLRLARCSTCGLLQLDTVVDPAAMFSHYLYTPSQSKKTLAHFEALADAATAAMPEKGLAVAIGSNDGTDLRFLQDRGWTVCGIDPAENLTKQANNAGLFTVCNFLNKTAVEVVLARFGKAKLITACNVFAHTPDWEEFAECAAALLAPDGRLVIEFPYGPRMLADGTFDLVYFEHASFPAMGPVGVLFKRQGMGIERVDYLPHIHGGSVRVWLRHGQDNLLFQDEQETYGIKACADFAMKTMLNRESLYDVVQICKSMKSRVVGYTAPAKCVTLLTAANLGASDIACIIDDNPLKQGRMLPALHIPVVSSAEANLGPDDTVIIFAWNVAEDIMAKLPVGCKVIIPMPEVQIRKVAAR